MYIVYGISKDGNVIDGANWSSKHMAYQIYFEYNYFGGIAFIIDTNYPSAFKEGLEAKRKNMVGRYIHNRVTNDIGKADKVMDSMIKLRNRQLKELNSDLRITIGRSIYLGKLKRPEISIIR